MTHLTGDPLFDDPLSLMPNPMLEWAWWEMQSPRCQKALAELAKVDIEEALRSEVAS